MEGDEILRRGSTRWKNDRSGIATTALRCSCNRVARRRIDRVLAATAALRRIYEAFARTGLHNSVAAIGVPRYSCNSLKRVERAVQPRWIFFKAVTTFIGPV